MPAWIPTAIGLGLSAGSTIFNIGQSLKSQREARQRYQDQVNQRVQGLLNEASNFEGDANALLQNLLGTLEQDGTRRGGIMYQAQQQLQDLDRFYDQGEAELKNLFNYAGMQGPRSRVMLNQLAAQRGEDREAFDLQFREARTQVARDVITATNNQFTSVRDTLSSDGSINRADSFNQFRASNGLQQAVQNQARSVFENNADILGSVADFVNNVNEVRSAFGEDEQYLVEDMLENEGISESYSQANLLAKAAAGGRLDEDEIERLGLQTEYSTTRSERYTDEDGNERIRRIRETTTLTPEQISAQLREAFEQYASENDLNVEFTGIESVGDVGEAQVETTIISDTRVEDIDDDDDDTGPSPDLTPPRDVGSDQADRENRRRARDRAARDSGGGYGRPSNDPAGQRGL